MHPSSGVRSYFLGSIIQPRKLITLYPLGWPIDVASGRGAFAEYAKAYSDIVWKVPEGTYSFEEVAATGIP